MSLFQLLEENLSDFMKSEIKRFKMMLSSDYRSEEGQNEDQALDNGDEEQRKTRRRLFLEITLHFLREMNSGGLAERLWNSRFIYTR